MLITTTTRIAVRLKSHGNSRVLLIRVRLDDMTSVWRGFVRLMHQRPSQIFTQ